MQIQFVSDLHNEVHRDTRLPERSMGARLTGTPVPDLPQTDADLIVLAGDIDNGLSGVQWARRQSTLHQKAVLYVPGNHEYYGGDLRSTRQEMWSAAIGSDVQMLDRCIWVAGNVRFLGVTLWTDYLAGAEPAGRDAAMREIGGLLSDHVCIHHGKRLLQPADALAEHEQSLAWLQDRLADSWEGKTVVISHHGPASVAQNPGYPVTSLTGAFWSNLESLLGPHIDLWIFGHTHTCVDQEVCGTRMVANQFGYRNFEEVPGFDPRRVVEL